MRRSQKLQGLEKCNENAKENAKNANIAKNAKNAEKP